MDNAKSLKVLHALLRAPHGHHGIMVIENGPCEASRCAREIAEALDWRVEVLEGRQVNLNDLEARESPLSRMVRHAVSSDKDYLVVIHGVPPEAVADEPWRRKLEGLARNVRLIVAMDGPPGHLHGWKLADLRK
jgi:hypothetical protein